MEEDWITSWRLLVVLATCRNVKFCPGCEHGGQKGIRPTRHETTSPLAHPERLTHPLNVIKYDATRDAVYVRLRDLTPCREKESLSCERPPRCSALFPGDVRSTNSRLQDPSAACRSVMWIMTSNMRSCYTSEDVRALNTFLIKGPQLCSNLAGRERC